jgi:glucokinase
MEAVIKRPEGFTLFPDSALRTGHAIGLDVGGTKIAAGLIADDGLIIDHLICPTPSKEDERATLLTIEHLVMELLDKHSTVQAIGVGAAGLVEWPDGRIRWAPNNAYHDLPLRSLLEEFTGLPVIVDNDANAASWAEAQFGAGIGHANIALVTVGTGIGCGLVLDDDVYRGATGLAAEVGHMTVDPHGSRCGCGNVGCLEAMASGAALGQWGREAAIAMPDGVLARLAGSPERVTGETVFQAAQQGDAVALRLFKQQGFWLGIGVASIVNMFDPSLVIIAGGLVATGELLLRPTRASYARFAFAGKYRRTPPIVAAGLGPDAGMVGAAALALRLSSQRR